MARKRPTASDVLKPVPAGVDGSARSASRQWADIDAKDAPGDDVAAIVIRAGELGFAASRVATALGISAEGVASIQQRTGTSTRARDDQSGDTPPGSTQLAG